MLIESAQPSIKNENVQWLLCGPGTAAKKKVDLRRDGLTQLSPKFRGWSHLQCLVFTFQIQGTLHAVKHQLWCILAVHSVYWQHAEHRVHTPMDAYLKQPICQHMRLSSDREKKSPFVPLNWFKGRQNKKWLLQKPLTRHFFLSWFHLYDI